MNKEASVIVLDVTPSMFNKNCNEDSYITLALKVIKQILFKKIFTDIKDEVAIVLYGTAGTANPLGDDDDNYQNITIKKNLSVSSFGHLECFNQLNPSDATDADFIEALIVAMDHLQSNLESRKGFKHRQIILLSSLMSPFVVDQIDSIRMCMNQQDIILNVINPKCAEDSSQTEESSSGSSHQKEALEAIEQLYTKVDGGIYSFQEALSRPNIFSKHITKSSAWKCNLDIGNDFSIPICAYIKMKSFKPAQSWKKVYANDPNAEFKQSSTFHLNDDDETEIDVNDTISAYYYGSTLVPVSEESEKYKCEKCFKVLGFTSKDNVPVYSCVGDNTMYVIAEPNNEVVSVAFSALVNALFETYLVAIVRRVYAGSNAPRIGCLKPHIKYKYECMIYNELPFHEDMMACQFNSLPVGGVSAAKKFKPSDVQLEAVDNLIDSMTFSNKDGEHNVFNSKNKPNPYLQKFYQCFEERVNDPTKPIPNVPSSLMNKLGVTFFENKEAMQRIKDNFELKELKQEKTKETGEKLFGKSNNSDTYMKASQKNVISTSSEQVSDDMPKEDFKQLFLAGKYFEDKREGETSEENAGKNESGSQKSVASEEIKVENSADDLLDEM